MNTQKIERLKVLLLDFKKFNSFFRKSEAIDRKKMCQKLFIFKHIAYPKKKVNIGRV